MDKTVLRTLLIALAFVALELRAAGVVVIGDGRLPRLDAPTLERIYLGRVIELNGIPITAVNAPTGSPVRDRFLQNVVKKGEDDYTGYWLVRRYSGQGVPPRELPSSAEIINFVKSTPGAIGYIEEADVPPGANILLRAAGPYAGYWLVRLYGGRAAQPDELSSTAEIIGFLKSTSDALGTSTWAFRWE